MVAALLLPGGVADAQDHAAHAQPPVRQSSPPLPDPMPPTVAPSRAGTVDPIRCWWQSSAGAITIGESFEVVLTCAVIETPSMQVVADESRLGVAAIQMAPFELLGGSHPADAHREQRRFFQYHYQLRLISADAIGRDVNVPALTIPYRVHSRVGAAASLEGRDLSYLMPALPIKVLSLVPREATDIRDGSDASLGDVEAWRFRGRMFEILAMALGAVATVVALMALVPLALGVRRTGPVAANRLPNRAVATGAARELAEVQLLATGEGWTESAVARALAATRVIAALAIRDAVSEKELKPGAPVPEGRLVASLGRLRPRRAAVSSAVTAADVAVTGARLEDGAPMTYRHQLEGLQSALAELTAALYRQAPTRDAALLNEAVRHALSVADEVKRGDNLWSRLRQAGREGTWWSPR